MSGICKINASFAEMAPPLQIPPADSALRCLGVCSCCEAGAGAEGLGKGPRDEIQRKFIQTHKKSKAKTKAGTRNKGQDRRPTTMSWTRKGHVCSHRLLTATPVNGSTRLPACMPSISLACFSVKRWISVWQASCLGIQAFHTCERQTQQEPKPFQRPRVQLRQLPPQRPFQRPRAQLRQLPLQWLPEDEEDSCTPPGPTFGGRRWEQAPKEPVTSNHLFFPSARHTVQIMGTTK